MQYAKRPSPITCATAGSIFTVGLVSLTARGIHTLTPYKLAHPFDVAMYVSSIVGIIGGGAFIAWLMVRFLRHEVTALRAENESLRAERDKLDTVLQAVKAADAQGEINGVRLTKLLKLIEEKQIPLGDTQELPKPRLHGIPGGGGA